MTHSHWACFKCECTLVPTVDVSSVNALITFLSEAAKQSHTS